MNKKKKKQIEEYCKRQRIIKKIGIGIIISLIVLYFIGLLVIMLWG